VWAVCVVYKLLPGMGILYKVYFDEIRSQFQSRSNREWLVACCPFLLCGVFLVPIPAILYMVVEVLHGIGVCLTMPIMYYDQESFFHVLQIMPILIREYDLRTNYIVNDEFSCGCNKYSLCDSLCRWNVDQSQKDFVNDLVVFGQRGLW